MAPAQGVSSSAIAKYVSDGFSQTLANVLEERLARIKLYVDEDRACTREELSRFVWGTARAVRTAIKPEDSDPRRRDAWQAAKGMLKELIDFDKFSPAQYHTACVKNVLEKKTAEVIDNYRNYVLTGEIRTRWFPPKLLGETDEILCIDKPCLYTCTYGGNKDDTSIPPVAGAESASALLNGDKAEIQIHEYLALKFSYETAVGTREWWKKGEKALTCYCGQCEYCACTQSGCCNRLDKETSGVMICAKTKAGFPEIRRQFASEHSLEKGGTEKYYFALVHGDVKLPKQDQQKSDHWKHAQVDGRGRVEVTMRWSKETHKSVPYDSGEGPSGPESPQWALTFYDPIAWFTDTKGKNRFTLVHVQIVTGRTHQIRFHLAEVGYPLVGDPTYGAPWSDREWAKRVFLHSYQTKFREPFTLRWFEATSPLPPDLGQVLMGLKLERMKEPWTGDPFLSRRDHPSLIKFLKQYDPTKPLLFSHDPPASAHAIAAAKGQMSETAVVGTVPADTAAPAGAVVPNGNAAVQGDNGNNWQGNTWDADGWKNDGWVNSWNSDDWKGGDWKTDTGQEAIQKPQAGAKQDDDDDDDWGGWSGGPGGQQQPQQPQQPQQQPAVKPPPEAAPRPPQQQLPEQPPQQTSQQRPLPELESAMKRPRQEVPAAMAGQAPTTPPATGPAAAPPPPSWRRMESRSQPGVFYYFNDASGTTQVEPPAPWEKRQSRSQPGVFYYWNSQTNATSVVKPEV